MKRLLIPLAAVLLLSGCATTWQSGRTLTTQGDTVAEVNFKSLGITFDSSTEGVFKRIIDAVLAYASGELSAPEPTSDPVAPAPPRPVPEDEEVGPGHDHPPFTPLPKPPSPKPDPILVNPDPPATPPAPLPPQEPGITVGRDALPVPFDQIVWDHKRVSDWPITSTLTAGISGSLLKLNHTKTCAWPSMYNKGVVNANAWAIHKRPADGKWHANTWDFMRVCQKEKGKEAVGSPDNWRPVKGEVIYVAVSGIARPGYPETVHERSQFIRLVWK